LSDTDSFPYSLEVRSPQGTLSLVATCSRLIGPILHLQSLQGHLALSLTTAGKSSLLLRIREVTLGCWDNPLPGSYSITPVGVLVLQGNTCSWSISGPLFCPTKMVGLVAALWRLSTGQPVLCIETLSQNPQQTKQTIIATKQNKKGGVRTPEALASSGGLRAAIFCCFVSGTSARSHLEGPGKVRAQPGPMVQTPPLPYL
jgi:hypothetical protein